VVDLASFKRGSLPDWSLYQACLLAVSTHGDGVPPPEARPVFDALKAAVAARAGAKPPPFSVLALGDTSYDKFCAAGKALEAYLLQLGGSLLSTRCDINKEDWQAIDAWFAATVDSLLARDLAPRFPLGSAAAAEPAPLAYQPLGTTKSHPLLARLVAREALTFCAGGADDKETIRLEFDVGAESGSALAYTPGDALGVYALNDPAEVWRLIKALRLSDHSAALVELPSWRLAWAGPTGRAGSSAPLFEVLLECCDLRDAKQQLLALLADCCGVSAVADGTQLLLRGGSSADTQAYLAARHIADVVLDAQLPPAPSPPLSPAQVVGLLRTLQPRLYSISSSPLEAPGRVAITVAVVRYEALNLARQGVCSTFLAGRLHVGEHAPVFISSNPDFRLPEDAATPLVMVGPGTGLAPFRAFIQHRRLASPAATPPTQLLFFGCRNADLDFLYSSELEAAHAAGAIRLFTAFSRPSGGAAKAYVQHRLAEQSAAVFSLLADKGAHFYVCGDGGRMAKDVHAQLLLTLRDGFERVHELSVDEAAVKAQAFVEEMEGSGRLQRDVWIS